MNKTETAHAPGPWDTRGTAGHEKHGQWAVYDEDGKDVAIVYDGDANARLIAAAPDLLAALEILTDHAGETYPHFESERGQADLMRATDAIRKAWGE